MRFLQTFPELQKCCEYENVVFYGKVVNIVHNLNYSTVNFYDGKSMQRFNVYSLDFDLTDNKLYKFMGMAYGFDRIWFKLFSAELITPTDELEQIFFPENYLKITAELQYIYLNTYGLSDNNIYKRILKACLDLGTSKAIDNEIFKNPASLKYHDNYKGGLINHIASMLNVARNLKEEYSATRKTFKDINWDLVYTLIYLHDIGKPLTYTQRKDNKFNWNENIQLNHASLGVCYVYSKCIEIGIDIKHPDVQILLKGIEQHMQPEINSIPEIQLVKSIDSIDSILATTI